MRPSCPLESGRQVGHPFHPSGAWRTLSGALRTDAALPLTRERELSSSARTFVSRRTVARVAAWSVPVVTMAAATPKTPLETVIVARIPDYLSPLKRQRIRLKLAKLQHATA